MLKKLIPTYYYKSIYDVPYAKLYADGIRLILTDLDNTLISYQETKPSKELIQWFKEIKNMGFELLIVSNSRKDRVMNFSNDLDCKYVKFSTKPLKRGMKKALKLASRAYNSEEVLFLGDQLMTDVFGANRMKFTSALIEAIDKKTDTFFTRTNRKIENFCLKRIEKKYPNEFDDVLREYCRR